MIGGKVVLPVMPDGTAGSDFNDVHAAAGLDEVARQLQQAAPPVEPIAEQGTVAETAPQAATESVISDGWQEPLLFEEIRTPEIPTSILSGWLRSFVEALAATTQTPPAMAVMMALATVAACVQKRFQVARTPDHIEPLSLWTVTGMPPASRKTAIKNALTAPIAAWEREQEESGRKERARIASIREVTEQRIKALQAQAVKAESADDRNELIEQAIRLKEQMPDALIAPRIYTGDVTAERLQNMMTEHGERMALISDEGGIFAVMSGLYTGGKANIDVFLQGHAGSAVRVDRQDRTAHLDAPALTFGLCIQPDVIRRQSDTVSGQRMPCTLSLLLTSKQHWNPNRNDNPYAGISQNGLSRRYNQAVEHTAGI